MANRASGVPQRHEPFNLNSRADIERGFIPECRGDAAGVGVLIVEAEDDGRLMVFGVGVGA